MKFDLSDTTIRVAIVVLVVAYVLIAIAHPVLRVLGASANDVLNLDGAGQFIGGLISGVLMLHVVSSGKGGTP